MNRKILIGVFEANSRVNNYFDGPFDQLPDNFVKGDAMRNAMTTFDPYLRGKIDRYGGLADGSGRVLLAPYTYYRTSADLMPFHQCVGNKRIAAADLSACFAMDWQGLPDLVAIKRLNATPTRNGKKTRRMTSRPPAAPIAATPVRAARSGPRP